jgi:hypothetical protein
MNMTNLTLITFSPRIKGVLAGLALVAIIFASRVPFLNAGYGVNVDAWRVARVARNIAQTGNYEASRLPGYPVHEIVCSLLWRGGPLALNGASAVFGIAAVLAFALFAARVGVRDFLLAGLAIAMTPIFYISSVTSKDYVWALAFVLVSLLAARGGRALLAGVLLGLATGCRITSLVMLLPIGLILIGASEGERRIRNILMLTVSCVAISAVVFWPVFAKYGSGVLTFYENHARPDWRTVLERGTIEIWGTVGVAFSLSSPGACSDLGC